MDKLSYQPFVDGTTKIPASYLNAVQEKINGLIDIVDANPTQAVAVISGITHSGQQSYGKVIVYKAGETPSSDNTANAYPAHLYDIVTVKAVPNSGYTFQKWSDGYVDATRNVLVTKEMLNVGKEFEAFFTSGTAKITANSADSTKGTVVIKDDAGATYNSPYTADLNSTVKLSVSTTTGYKFKEWKKDGQVVSGATTAGDLTITVTEDATYTAYFEAIPAGPVNIELDSDNKVTMTAEVSGQTIEYSTDNGANWTPYTEELTLTATTTIIARSIAKGGSKGDIPIIKATWDVDNTSASVTSTSAFTVDGGESQAANSNVTLEAGEHTIVSGAQTANIIVSNS